MLSTIRSFFRGILALEAIVLFLNMAYSIIWGFPHRGIPVTPITGAVLAIVFLMAILCAAGWWTSRQDRPGRNYFAIAAYTANFIATIPLVYFGYKFHLPFATTNLLLTLANLTGIIAFSQSLAAPAAATPKVRHVSGDWTNPWLDKVFGVIIFIAVWCLFSLWHRFGVPQGSESISSLTDILFFVLAVIIDATIHELGHAIMASAFQMKMLAFNAGPFQWRRVDGRRRFRINPSGLLGGSVSVVPTHPDHPDWQEACVLVAGPLANLCTAPLFVWTTLQLQTTSHVVAWVLFRYIATFAVIDGIFNFFPIRTSDGAYSDGARLLQLLTGSHALHYVRAIHRGQLTLFTPLRSRDLNAADMQRAADVAPSERARLLAHVLAAQIFEDLGRIPEAATEVAAAESIYNAHNVQLPSLLHTVFVYFDAVYNHNPVAARLWWDRMNAKKIDRKNVDYWIAATAIAWIENRPAEAEAAWRHANDAAQKLPHFGAYEFDRDRVAHLRALLDAPAPSTDQQPEFTSSTALPPPVARATQPNVAQPLVADS